MNTLQGLTVVETKEYNGGIETTLSLTTGNSTQYYALLEDSKKVAAKATLWAYPSKNSMPILPMGKVTRKGKDTLQVVSQKRGCLKNLRNKLCIIRFQEWLKRVEDQRIKSISNLLNDNDVSNETPEKLESILPELETITRNLSWRNRTEQIRKLAAIFCS